MHVELVPLGVSVSRISSSAFRNVGPLCFVVYCTIVFNYHFRVGDVIKARFHWATLVHATKYNIAFAFALLRVSGRIIFSGLVMLVYYVHPRNG